jgi:hypothetical protein
MRERGAGFCTGPQEHGVEKCVRLRESAIPNPYPLHSARTLLGPSNAASTHTVSSACVGDGEAWLTAATIRVQQLVLSRKGSHRDGLQKCHLPGSTPPGAHAADRRTGELTTAPMSSSFACLRESPYVGRDGAVRRRNNCTRRGSEFPASGPLTSTSDQLEFTEAALRQVRAEAKNRQAGAAARDHCVFFVPRRTIICEKVVLCLLRQGRSEIALSSPRGFLRC